MLCTISTDKDVVYNEKPTFSVAGPNRFRKYKALQKEFNKSMEETVLNYH